MKNRSRNIMRFTPKNINSKNTWQIATGDNTRNFSDIFLKYGVALVGPGDPGKEGLKSTSLFYSLNPDYHNWGKELKKIKLDEWIIARKGKQKIVAIGKVLGEYDHSNFFEDVDGWELQHFVKVKWFVPNTKDKLIRFKNLPLGQSTLQKCNKAEIYDKIYNTNFIEYKSEFLEKDFQLSPKLSIENLIEAFIDKGVRIQDAENIGSTIKRIIRLTEWYKTNDKFASEHEVVSFLIIPFLIALGWSEQKLKLEYKHIDIALFEKSFIGDYETSPKIILEAKKFRNGLALTDKQINSYGKAFPNCEKFIVTNGYRYKYFERVKGKIKYLGYFNLLKLYENNAVNGVSKGLIETMLDFSNL